MAMVENAPMSRKRSTVVLEAANSREYIRSCVVMLLSYPAQPRSQNVHDDPKPHRDGEYRPQQNHADA